MHPPKNDLYESYFFCLFRSILHIKLGVNITKLISPYWNDRQPTGLNLRTANVFFFLRLALELT